ncbi:MAG: TRAP transporter small permease [Hoeflea sp.]|uniref:TRAP transporter small permease n=1 Tax=Hoeflea sp. TaxID=1940281 RepID=UPI0032995C84
MLLLFLAIAGLVGAGVVARLSRVVLPWTNEAAQLLLVWMIFLGANIGTYYRDHVGVGILPESFSGTAQRVMFLFIKAAILAFSGYIVWSGTEFMLFQKLVGGSTFSLPIDVPKYLVALGLPVAFGAGCLHIIVDIITDPFESPYARRPFDEAASEDTRVLTNSRKMEKTTDGKK